MLGSILSVLKRAKEHGGAIMNGYVTPYQWGTPSKSGREKKYVSPTSEPCPFVPSDICRKVDYDIHLDGSYEECYFNKAQTPSINVPDPHIPPETPEITQISTNDNLLEAENLGLMSRISAFLNYEIPVYGTSITFPFYYILVLCIISATIYIFAKNFNKSRTILENITYTITTCLEYVIDEFLLPAYDIIYYVLLNNIFTLLILEFYTIVKGFLYAQNKKEEYSTY